MARDLAEPCWSLPMLKPQHALLAAWLAHPSRARPARPPPRQSGWRSIAIDDGGRVAQGVAVGLEGDKVD